MVALMDDLLLLAAGRLAYTGPMAQAVRAFARVGFK